MIYYQIFCKNFSNLSLLDTWLHKFGSLLFFHHTLGPWRRHHHLLNIVLILWLFWVGAHSSHYSLLGSVSLYNLPGCWPLSLSWPLILSMVNWKHLWISFKGIKLVCVLACPWPYRVSDAEIDWVFDSSTTFVICHLIGVNIEWLTSLGQFG